MSDATLIRDSAPGFDAAVRRVLLWEGGYVNDFNDPGGETNFGISAASYPDCDIANLTEADAIAIYRRDWWDKYGMGSLPPAIAGKYLDMAVNMGAGQAGKLIQRACNHCGAMPALAVDGIIGPASRKEIAYLCTPDRGSTLLGAIRVEAGNFYREIASVHPQLRRFLNGWLRRAAD